MHNIIDATVEAWLFGSNSTVLDHFALLCTNAFVWIPLYLALIVLVIKNNENMQQICLCIGGALLSIIVVSLLCAAVVKPLTARLRPCNDPEFMYMAHIVGDLRSRDYSFFSSHAANTMAIATFFAFLVRSRLLNVALFSWALLNCWTRLYLGQHFLTDILVGILAGMGTAAGIYTAFRHMYSSVSPGMHFVSSHYTPSGYLYVEVDRVVAVELLTIIGALLYSFVAATPMIQLPNIL